MIEQIDQIMEVLHLKYMKAKITYEGMQRIERYFVPDEALREALLNALCHKQYEAVFRFRLVCMKTDSILPTAADCPKTGQSKI